MSVYKFVQNAAQLFQTTWLIAGVPINYGGLTTISSLPVVRSIRSRTEQSWALIMKIVNAMSNQLQGCFLGSIFTEIHKCHEVQEH